MPIKNQIRKIIDDKQVIRTAIQWNPSGWEKQRCPGVTSGSGWRPMRPCAAGTLLAVGLSASDSAASYDFGFVPIAVQVSCGLPSGKHTKSYWKLPFIADLHIKMVIFQSFCLFTRGLLIFCDITGIDMGTIYWYGDNMRIIMGY